ncbi:MAG TPA: hypothetical protein VMZ92_12200 [Planctomycetota bacterium]|nr:hypothetical protein [Planctomycetota bacterium]
MREFADFFWVGFVAVTVFTAFAWWWRARVHIAQHPESAPGYRRLIRGFALWANLPWVVMGLGLTVGGVRSIDAYLRPSEANPWVLAFYLSAIFVWALCLWWLFKRDGAQKLIDHPGLFNWSPRKPKHVRLIGAVGAVVTGVAVIFLFTGGMLPYLTTRADGWTTAFIIYDGFWRVAAFLLLPIAIGVVGLIVFIPWFRRLVRQPGWWRTKESGIVLPLFICGVFLVVGGLAFWLRMRDACHLVSVYTSGGAKTVEGTVHVLREQPEGGHKPGDLVEIGGVQFVVNRFRQVTAAYTETIAWGGVLTEGRHVRVWYWEGQILRVDVRQ